MTTLRFSNGDQMPALGLGTWKSAPDTVGAAVQAAVRMGYRHIDCAFIYKNEAEIGDALAALFEEGVVRREELWITSKLWNTDQHPDDVQAAVKATLRALQLTYLDLYLIHWPVALRRGVAFGRPGAFIPRAALPLTETWAAMEALVTTGLTRHIGVSNFNIATLRALSGASRPPEVNQIELHPFLQQPKLVQWCQDNGIHVTAYSPLGSGDRVASMKAADEVRLLDDPVVIAVASRHGCSPAQVLLQWSLARGCSVIPKSVNPGRLAQNLAAGKVRLTPEDTDALARLERNLRYVHGRFWTRGDSPYTLEDLWET